MGAAPISTGEAAGDADTEHKFPGWSSARTPGLGAPGPGCKCHQAPCHEVGRIWVLHPTCL